MRLLAIRADGRTASAALVEGDGGSDGRVVGHAEIVGTEIADRLIPLLAELPGALAGEVDMIAVDRGPGGFTAVRAAVTAARALALALGRPLVPLSTFETFASAARPAAGEQILVAIDSRRGSFLLQRFESGEVSGSGPASGWRPGEALDDLRRPLVVVGSGASAVAGCLGAGSGIRVEACVPDARNVGLLALRSVGSGLAPPPPFTVQPLYLRPPDARPPRRLIERAESASRHNAGPQP